jgi:hypothetical protein
VDEYRLTLDGQPAVADTVAFDGPDCCWPGPGRNPCPPYPSAVNVKSPLPAALAVTLPDTPVLLQVFVYRV